MKKLEFNRVALLALCLFTSIGASGCFTLNDLSHLTGGTPPKVGLRIIKTVPGGSADLAGLQPMDLLARYGDFEIVDDATFFRARDFYQSTKGVVQLEVWHGRERLRPKVQVGPLGIETNEYNPVMYKFNASLQELEVPAEIPLEYRDKFKDSLPKAETVLARAGAIIDQGEQSHSITRAQALVSRILLISDDAPADQVQLQNKLLSELVATESASYLEYLGSNTFFPKQLYRPARACFKKHLELNPNNASIQLNLGIACNSLGLYDEAQAATDYVEEHRLGLSDYGMIVLYQVKAGAALGHGHYAEAMSLADRVFEIHRKPYDISLVQLAAARAGDLQKLAEATSRYEKMLPGEFEQQRYQADAIAAYALVRLKQRERARQLVLKWRDGDRIESRVADYWRMYPEGAEVAKNWKELMKS